MSDRGKYLGDGYVPRLGPVRVFHDVSSTKRLIVVPVKYDSGETSLARSRVRWRKSASKSKSTG